MDWSSIFYAAVGSALGGGLGGLINYWTKKKQLGSIATGILVLIGFFGVKALYKDGTLPRITPIVIQENESPSLFALQKNHPGKFKKLMSFIDVPTRNGALKDEDYTPFRIYLAKITEDFKSRAPAEYTRKSTQISLTQFEILNEKRPDICTAQIQGKPFPTLENILGARYVNQEAVLLADLFSLSQDDMIDPIDASTGEDIYLKIFKAALRQNELEASEILTSVDHVKNCQVFIQINQSALDLNDEDLRKFAAYQATFLQ